MMNPILLFKKMFNLRSKKIALYAPIYITLLSSKGLLRLQPKDKEKLLKDAKAFFRNPDDIDLFFDEIREGLLAIRRKERSINDYIKKIEYEIRQNPKSAKTIPYQAIERLRAKKTKRTLVQCRVYEYLYAINGETYLPPKKEEKPPSELS